MIDCKLDFDREHIYIEARPEAIPEIWKRIREIAKTAALTNEENIITVGLMFTPNTAGELDVHGSIEIDAPWFPCPPDGPGLDHNELLRQLMDETLNKIRVALEDVDLPNEHRNDLDNLAAIMESSKS